VSQQKAVRPVRARLFASTFLYARTPRASKAFFLCQGSSSMCIIRAGLLASAFLQACI